MNNLKFLLSTLFFNIDMVIDNLLFDGNNNLNSLVDLQFLIEEGLSFGSEEENFKVVNKVKSFFKAKNFNILKCSNFSLAFYLQEYTNASYSECLILITKLFLNFILKINSNLIFNKCNNFKFYNFIKNEINDEAALKFLNCVNEIDDEKTENFKKVLLQLKAYAKRVLNLMNYYISEKINVRPSFNVLKKSAMLAVANNNGAKFLILLSNIGLFN